MKTAKIPLYDIQYLQFEIPFKCERCGNEVNHIIPVFGYHNMNFNVNERCATLHKDKIYVGDECEICGYAEYYEIRAMDCEKNRLLIDKLNELAQKIKTMRKVNKIFDIKKFGGVK